MIGLLFDKFGHIDDISCGDCRNSDADGRFTVDTHQVGRRGLIAFFDFCNIRKPEVFACAWYNGEITDIVQGVEVSGRFDADAVESGFDPSSIDDLILGFESTGDVGRGNSAPGHDRWADVNIDSRCLHSVNFYFGYIFGLQQFIFNLFGLFFKFPVGMSFAGKTIKYP